MTDDIQKFKLIFLGDQGVGKSSILNRFAQDKFDPEYQATIGLDFHSKQVVINGVNVRLLLYDTAGQEKFKSLIPMYIRDANIIIVVYDVTIKESFTHTNHWVNETKELKREDAIFCLVGNKIDLDSQRQVNLKEAEDFAKEREFLFYEVSAKTGQNVQDLFNSYIFPQMAKKFNIIADSEEGEQTTGNNGGDNQGNVLDNIKLGEGGKKVTKGGCCGRKRK